MHCWLQLPLHHQHQWKWWSKQHSLLQSDSRQWKPKHKLQDLTAASDSVDHNTLLHCLHQNIPRGPTSYWACLTAGQLTPPSPTLPSLIKTYTVSPTWVWKWSPTSARLPSSTPGTAEEHKSGIQQTDALNCQHHSHCVCGSVASRDTGQELHGLKLAVFNVIKQNIDTSIKYAHDHDTPPSGVHKRIKSNVPEFFFSLKEVKWTWLARESHQLSKNTLHWRAVR